MIFTIIPALLVVFIILGSGVYLYVKDILESEGRNEANLIVRDFASRIEAELLVHFDVQKQFNILFSHYESVSTTYRRKLYVDMTYDLLEKNEKILSAWVDFDRNAFDGQDNKYKSVGIFPRSGRFS
jgi:hypothetical protein